MSTKAYKILGQAAPTASTNTDLYVVPALTQAVISTLKLVNRSKTATVSYRIAVIPSGESLAAEHYIAYDKFLNPRGDRNFTIGITLNAGDKIVVYSDTADTSYSLFGAEITP